MAGTVWCALIAVLFSVLSSGSRAFALQVEIALGLIAFLMRNMWWLAGMQRTTGSRKHWRGGSEESLFHGTEGRANEIVHAAKGCC